MADQQTRRLPEGPKTTRGGWTATGTSARRRARVDPAADTKAARTREHLLDAARRAFARHGYLDTTIDHIVSEAGLARGSFYSYFESKSDIVIELVTLVNDHVDRTVVSFDRPADGDPRTNLETSNRNYLEVVRENTDLYRLVEEVAAHTPSVREARLASRRQHVDRVASSIRRWQKRGLADPHIDARSTASALVSMLSASAQWRYVHGDLQDDEQLLASLNHICVQACGLHDNSP